LFVEYFNLSYLLSYFGNPIKFYYCVRLFSSSHFLIERRIWETLERC